jgi:hypothetical protein
VSDWNFDCEKCGACCKVIGCPDLTKDNLCAIYNNRPFVCDSKKMYDEVHSKTMTKQEYFDKAKIACNQLKELL